MDEPFEAWCILTTRDFADALAAHHKARPRWMTRVLRNLLYVLLAFFGILILTSLIVLPRPPESAHPAVVLVVLAVLASPLVLGRWTTQIDAWRLARRYTEDLRNQRWSIDDQALIFRTPQSESLLRWDYFGTILESADSFLLYVTKMQFQVLPTRAFPSRTAMERFAALAAERAKEYVVLGRCQYPDKPTPAGLTDF